MAQTKTPPRAKPKFKSSMAKKAASMKNPQAARHSEDVAKALCAFIMDRGEGTALGAPLNRQYAGPAMHQIYMAKFYQKHPSAKPLIQGRLRKFIDQHHLLLKFDNERQLIRVRSSAREAARPQAKPSAPSHLAWELAAWVAERGGSIRANELAKFYAEYPDARQTMGKAGDFCRDYPDILNFRSESGGTGVVHSLLAVPPASSVRTHDDDKLQQPEAAQLASESEDDAWGTWSAEKAAGDGGPAQPPPQRDADDDDDDDDDAWGSWSAQPTLPEPPRPPRPPEQQEEGGGGAAEGGHAEGAGSSGASASREAAEAGEAPAAPTPVAEVVRPADGVLDRTMLLRIRRTVGDKVHPEASHFFTKLRPSERTLDEEIAMRKIGGKPQHKAARQAEKAARQAAAAASATSAPSAAPAQAASPSSGSRGPSPAQGGSQPWTAKRKREQGPEGAGGKRELHGVAKRVLKPQPKSALMGAPVGSAPARPNAWRPAAAPARQQGPPGYWASEPANTDVASQAKPPSACGDAAGKSRQDLMRAVKDAVAAMERGLQSEDTAAVQERKAHEQQVQQLEQRWLNLTRELRAREERIEKLHKDNKEFEAICKDQMKAVKDLEQRCQGLEEQLEEQKADAGASKDVREDFEVHKKLSEKRIAQLEEDLDHAQASSQRHKDELAEQVKRRRLVERDLEELDERRSNAQTLAEEKRKKSKALAVKLEETEADRKDLLVKLDETEAKLQRADSRAEDLLVELATVKQQQASSKGSSCLVAKLLAQKKELDRAREENGALKAELESTRERLEASEARAGAEPEWACAEPGALEAQRVELELLKAEVSRLRAQTEGSAPDVVKSVGPEPAQASQETELELNL